MRKRERRQGESDEARNGDSAEFESVMKRYADIVLRVCTLYFPQKTDAEDAFQTTFMKYATAHTAFESEEHRKAWLIRVAENVCKDILKSSAHRTTPVDSIEETLPARHAEDAGSEGQIVRMDLRDALATLPEQQRLVLFLTYHEGYKATELAELLEEPVNTIYTHLARGRKHLKEVLGDA